MDLAYWLDRTLIYVEVFDERLRIMVLLFLAFCVFSVALRLLLMFYYRAQLATFALYSRESVTRDSLEKFKKGLMGRIAKDFIEAGRRGVSHIDARAIAEKHVNRLSLLGWSYQGIETFLHNFQTGILWTGLLFILAAPDKLTLGLGTLVLYLGFMLLSSMFNLTQARERLTNEIICYVNNEIGKFFIGDTASAVNLLRGDLKMGINGLAETLTKSIDNFGKRYEDELVKVVGVIGDKYDSTYHAAFSDFMKQTKAFMDSTQELLDTLSGNVAKLTSVTKTTDDGVKAHMGQLGEQSRSLAQLSEQIIDIIKYLQQNALNLSDSGEALAESLKFVKANQQVLTDTLAEYEVTTKKMTSQMGEALGRILEYHAQQAFDSIDEKISGLDSDNSNSAVLEQLREIFTHQQEQTQVLINAITHLREQQEIEFRAMRK